MMEKTICPVWMGYVLASPLRRLLQNPETILGPYVKPGMTVLDIGCAMGFFSLPMARMVGPSGRVVCVDCQENMLTKLAVRASREGMCDRFSFCPCTLESLCLEGLEARVDFALAMAMVHEVPDATRFYAEAIRALKPGARFLLAEPRGHVSIGAFDSSVSIAEEAGFMVLDTPPVARCHAALLTKNE